MARPLSSDLRTRVVARVAEGETVRAVASLFGLSVPSVVKWSRRWRATGSCEASPMGGKRRDVMRRDGTTRWPGLRNTPRCPCAGSGPGWPRAGSGSAMARCGVSPMPRGCRSKKAVLAAETGRPDIARRRARWRRHQHRIDPRRLVFIEETRAQTNMAPRRGRGPRGTRLPGRAPQGHWRRMTFVGAPRVERIDAPCVIDGPINGDLFRACVEPVLLPDPASGRRGGHGRSRQPQGRRGAKGHAGGRRASAVPPAIQPGSEPHRTRSGAHSNAWHSPPHVRRAQAPHALRRRTHRRSRLETPRHMT